jgi:serine/threonine-protein kinase SRPK3
VSKKLGWGHFSTVWMAEDLLSDRSSGVSKFVALKVVKSASVYAEAAVDEIELLSCVAKAAHGKGQTPPVVSLLDNFVHHGVSSRPVRTFVSLPARLTGLSACLSTCVWVCVCVCVCPCLCLCLYV